MRQQFECYQVTVLKDPNKEPVEIVTMVHIYKDQGEAIDFAYMANVHLFNAAKPNQFEYIDGPYQSVNGG